MKEILKGYFKHSFRSIVIHFHFYECFVCVTCIIESVDSISRDGPDVYVIHYINII